MVRPTRSEMSSLGSRTHFGHPHRLRREPAPSSTRAARLAAKREVSEAATRNRSSDFARRVRRSTGTLEGWTTYISTHASSASAPARTRQSSLVDRNHALDAAAGSGGAGAISGNGRPQCPGFWVDRALRFYRQARHCLQAPNFCYSLRSRGQASCPQRQVSQRRLSATSKDPPVWYGRQPSRRASFMGSLSAVHMTAGHNALRGSGPGH